MIKQDTFKVTFENGVRPAGKQNECFYCHKGIGHFHKEDCVCRRKTIVLDYTYRMVVTVPVDWDQSQIEFHRNEGSWCADNSLRELLKSFKYMKKRGYCQCGFDKFEMKFIREATEEDEENYGIV